MLNVSHNRLDNVQGLASLQALIAANFGKSLHSRTQEAKPCHPFNPRIVASPASSIYQLFSKLVADFCPWLPDGNALRKLEFGKSMPRLRILRLSSNKLSELAVTALPNLRTLYADNNSLSTVTKVDRLTKLENLSLRNQSGRAL